MKVAIALLVALRQEAAAIDSSPVTCSNIKGIYQENACCNDTPDKHVDTASYAIGREADPPVPGVQQGKAKAHVLLGMAPDYPPYTAWTSTVPVKLGGFNYEFGKLMEPICGIKVDYILAPWSGCWTAKPAELYFPEVTEYVGKDIWDGRVHGCTAYTHTVGERELSLEFTHSILGGQKTAGILTRLEGGKPIISPSVWNYSGVKLGDVSGWAPTADTFKYNVNSCAGRQFHKPENLLVPGTTATDDGNGPAMAKLLDGTFDALYIYSDQMYQFLQSGDPLANGFGTTFAYIHTGLGGWSINGTTLAISKSGSGLKTVLDPCIQQVSQTQNYTTLCESYFSPGSCIQNAYSNAVSGQLFYDSLMNARTDSNTCANGYCTCSSTCATNCIRSA